MQVQAAGFRHFSFAPATETGYLGGTNANPAPAAFTEGPLGRVAVGVAPQVVRLPVPRCGTTRVPWRKLGTQAYVIRTGETFAAALARPLSVEVLFLLRQFS